MARIGERNCEYPEMGLGAGTTTGATRDIRTLDAFGLFYSPLLYICCSDRLRRALVGCKVILHGGWL